MCRWLVLVAPADSPLPIGDLLTKPRHSLVRQAMHAVYHPGFSSTNNHTLNADGFGVAWYTRGPSGGGGDARATTRAAIYRSIAPAWSDRNLAELACAVESSTIMGHVRAASPGTVVSLESCHPFRHGRLTLMHTGHVEQFARMRRALLARLTDQAFAAISGLTDSEHCFALLLSSLREPARTAPFEPAELAAAVRAMIAAVLELLDEVGVRDGFTSLNFAISDGETCVATRFCDRWPQIPPPSLYFALPAHEELLADLDGGGGGEAAGGDAAAAADDAAASPLAHDEATAHERDSDRWARMEHFLAAVAVESAPSRSLLVASEPATTAGNVKWLNVAANSMLTYTRGRLPRFERLEMGRAAKVK